MRTPSIVSFVLVAVAACGATSSTNVTDGSTPTTVPAGAPAWAAALGNGVSVAIDGDVAVVTTLGVPDHRSPYFASTDSRYEAYNGTNPRFSLNPNRIAESRMVLRIPITPRKQATPSATPLGPIGVAVNGVAIFNQFAGPNQPLTGEIDSFDQYAGHPQQMGTYHYHVEPAWLTRTTREALVGVLLDGYPVYGPLENGRLITSADLDAAHGHTTATREYPSGTYHYHTTGDAPYINGSGFAGVPGTVAR
jgi:hypothetical protein